MRNKFLLTALVVALGIVALGIFTTADAKGPPFRKGPKAEVEVSITRPSSDLFSLIMSYGTRTPILFQATATDAKGNDVSDTLDWESDLIGTGLFVWSNFAAAAKPEKPGKGKPGGEKPGLLLTFISGDVIAEPLMMEGRDSKRGIKLAGGPITATIDFVKLEPNVCTGSAEWLHYMQAKNPITYSKLSVNILKSDANPQGVAWFEWDVMIDGTEYQVVMNAFLSATVDCSPTECTIQVSEGRLAIQSGKEYLVISRGVDLVFSVSK